MVTGVEYGENGRVAGIWYAPFTSTLDTTRVRHVGLVCRTTDLLSQGDHSAWAPVNWCISGVSEGETIHPEVMPLCLNLGANRSFNARPSHVWVKDKGVFISVSEWSARVQRGEAENLDCSVAQRGEAMRRWRKDHRAICECIPIRFRETTPTSG